MSDSTLLFADDSATMRAIMEKTFSGENINVVSVPSGQAAIEKAKELLPGLVIADAGMSGISGYDVCETLKSDPATAHIPVIIMSGISNPYDESRGQAVKATDHVKKPFDTSKLIEHVNEMIIVSPTAVTKEPPKEPPMEAATPGPKPPIQPERPNPKSTLHAFPRPGLTHAADAPVAPPVSDPFANIPPVPPPSSNAVQSDVSDETDAPAPIELETVSDNEADIRVGTLAELAQMDDNGDSVIPEPSEDAIDLVDEEGPIELVNEHPGDKEIAEDSSTTDTTPTTTPSSDVSHAVEAATAKAASEIAQGVDGVTPEQARMITSLSQDIIEKVVWDVVPDLAETIIKEKLEQLLK